MTTHSKTASIRRYEWENPNSGHHGWIRPTEWYEDGYHGHDGPCRAFEATTWVDDDKETASGVACRRHNGTWKIINEDGDD